MNKMLKLPIFLGISGAACAGILAGVYAFTNPIIQNAKLEKANAAYISMYQEFGVAASDITTEEVENISGCTTRAIVKNSSVKGIAYTCEAKGYGGTISFQVAFANGKYLSYTDLGNSETSGYGKTAIENMATTINGIDANEALLDNSTYTTAVSGRSVTGKAIAKVVENCRVDYMAWYNVN